MSPPLKILISAGEASGDRLGAGLAQALLRRLPDAEIVGMGGERMRRAGVHLIQDADEVAVVGFLEVLSHLGALRRAKQRLEQHLEGQLPDLFVPIDFPDFNLRLARRARRCNVPVVYFVSPQVWAWRPGRVRRIRHLVRRMLVLFPFEISFYESAGVPVSFVGHPAAEHLPAPPSPEALRAKAGLKASRPAVALVPGSRRGEVARLLPILLEAATRLARRADRPQFLLPLAPGLDGAWVRGLVRQSAPAEIRLHEGDFPAILACCQAGVVAAGTASLEAATVGMPMVVAYRMSLPSYLLGRALVRVEHVALPNLIAGRRVVPELIQGECTPERIAAGVSRYLDRPGEGQRTRRALLEVRERLGQPGIFERAADEILRELGRA